MSTDHKMAFNYQALFYRPAHFRNLQRTSGWFTRCVSNTVRNDFAIEVTIEVADASVHVNRSIYCHGTLLKWTANLCQTIDIVAPYESQVLNTCVAIFAFLSLTGTEFTITGTDSCGMNEPPVRNWVWTTSVKKLLSTVTVKSSQANELPRRTLLKDVAFSSEVTAH